MKKDVLDAQIEAHLREKNEKLVEFAKACERLGFHRGYSDLREMAIKALRNAGEWPQ